MANVNRAIAYCLIKGARLYQLILSPLCLGCRFEPTCSIYAVEAVQTYGCVKGSYYAVCRLLRCHPWHPGGIDPVP